MAEKVTKVEVKPIPSDREGFLSSVVTQSADLAERAATTFFGVVRDVQQSAVKLVRAVDERIDKLANEGIDTAENLTLGVLRAIRDTGRGVTDLATNLGKPRDLARAA